MRETKKKGSVQELVATCQQSERGFGFGDGKREVFVRSFFLALCI